MAAYNSYSKRVKNALKMILGSITYDVGNGPEPAFTGVTGTSAGEFDSYPTLRVLPGNQLTEKASVAENDRTLVYAARVHMPLENSFNSESAYDYIYDLTDLILDKLDVGDTTGALHAADNTLTNILMLNATRGDWAFYESNAGILLGCDIDIEVKYSKDLL